jgi:archaellum component FlaF (FlaF/FlaG flagellin family)
MKKRDLLFAGTLIMCVSALAQPTFTSQDAKVIFTQNFEANWDEWSTENVDSIKGLWYYDNTKTGSQANVKIWEDTATWGKRVFRADTVLYLQNGVVVTDDPNEVKNDNFPGESYTIATDETTERRNAFLAFGEADGGGSKVFKYTSDTCTLTAQSWGTYKGGYTANYRRNLFVRNLPIEEESSYRLTFYLKTKTVPGHDASPRMSAGIFRGYFHAEKPFSMGLEDASDNYKYKTAIEYDKQDFAEEDEWEKVTYMTYYLNDSIADRFVFVDGYWWQDNWIWKNVENGDTVTRLYHVQPDKFFVRLGFVSDYTEFQLDNLSLTKSWIAGAEYFKDKIRIDFGYKTNLAELAKAAKAKTNIAAAEVGEKIEDQDLIDSLGYEYRFELWGQKEN